MGKEWWYFNGILEDQDGREYSFCYIVFYFLGLKNNIAVLNIVNLGTGRLVFGRVEKYPIASFENPSDILNFRMGNSYLRYAGKNTFALDIREMGFSLDLTLHGLKPPVLHGDSGYILMGGQDTVSGDDTEKSAYYSCTRMTAEGAMIARGETLRLKGDAWMDHQWGKWDTGERYDWFSFRFGDSTELMLYRFRDEEGKTLEQYLVGTYVDRDGNPTAINDFHAEPLGHYWIESDSVRKYPLRWRVQVPSQGIEVTLEAIAEDQFFWLDEKHLVWEGACRVTRGNREGYCFLEMVGY